MHERVADLAARRAKAKELGGESRIERQHGKGKLTCRERLDILLDEESFFEMGIHGSEYASPLAAADGVVIGTGRIDGRTVCIAAYDFTVMGGSIGIASGSGPGGLGCAWGVISPIRGLPSSKRKPRRRPRMR